MAISCIGGSKGVAGANAPPEFRLDIGEVFSGEAPDSVRRTVAEKRLTTLPDNTVWVWKTTWLRARWSSAPTPKRHSPHRAGGRRRRTDHSTGCSGVEAASVDITKGTPCEPAVIPGPLQPA